MKSPHGLYTFHRFKTKENWVQWTKTGLLPEDAPTIMGENPWKCIKKLLEEKTNLTETPKNEAMTKALTIKPQVLEEYKKTSREELKKANIQSKERPWQRAGLDGISKNRWHIVEIKVGQYALKKASELQRIPPFYYAEGQHILAITGLPYMTFHFHDGEKTHTPLTLPLRRNNKYIETLIQKETEFFKTLQTQHLNPNKALVEKVQAAILKTGPKVEYASYQIVVPNYLLPNGTPTPKGLEILSGK